MIRIIIDRDVWFDELLIISVVGIDVVFINSKVIVEFSSSDDIVKSIVVNIEFRMQSFKWDFVSLIISLAMSKIDIFHWISYRKDFFSDFLFLIF